MNDENATPNQPDKSPDSSPEIQGAKSVNSPDTAPPQSANEFQDVKKELGGYERSTPSWTRIIVGVNALTCLFIALQWHEMKSGSADTHALAEAAKKQSEKMSNMSDAADQIKKAAQDMVIQDQRIADNAQKALDASTQQAAAALNAGISASQKSNAIAREALDAQTRPWLGIQSDLTPVSSGRTDNGRRNATFSFVLRNYGQSPAMRVAYEFRFNDMFSKNQVRETSACDEATARSTASNPLASITLPTIFPGDSGVTPPITYSLEADVFPQFLVGCIAYQGQAGGIVHTTRVIYSIRQDKIKGEIFMYIPSGTTTD